MALMFWLMSWFKDSLHLALPSVFTIEPPLLGKSLCWDSQACHWQQMVENGLPPPKQDQLRTAYVNCPLAQGNLASQFMHI